MIVLPILGANSCFCKVAHIWICFLFQKSLYHNQTVEELGNFTYLSLYFEFNKVTDLPKPVFLQAFLTS